MLFDLQGKRRRVVQATYLMLAVLMGGGLVLFGIGGDVSGGLFDAFSDRGAGSGSDVVEERVDRNEERIKTNPKAAAAARKELVRDYYSLAVGQTDQAGTFPTDAQDELRNASAHWTAYLKSDPNRLDPSLARVALQVYDPVALNRPNRALEAARILAEQSKDASSYLLLVQYAVLAGDKRAEKLATAKAYDLAPKKQRKAVRAQITQIKSAAVAAQLQQQGALDVGDAPKQGRQQGGGGGSGGGGK